MNTTFQHLFDTYDWNTILNDIDRKTEKDILFSLSKESINLEDFKTLISAPGKLYLEQMAFKSRALTKKRFGNVIQMYAPLYLSNECQNICSYCGFSITNQIPRRTLTEEEILKEAFFLKSKGFNHILLVTGEANKTVGVTYIKNAISLLNKHFSNISIEVQPLEQEAYEELIQSGLYGVLIYQETYHRDAYKKHHLKGKKSNFNYRLDTPDRLGKSGIHKIGLGALFGLEDFRTDAFFTALHLKYLQKTYWKTKYTISFPRLRPHSGFIDPKVEMDDSDLLQIICAFRLLDENVELSISTRESEIFRDNVVNLGITSMSAESKTNPGGYVVDRKSLEQFEISDERSTEMISAMLRENGLEPVWKDWNSF